MNNKVEYLKSTITATDYEPFMNGDEQAGEVHWLGTENSSGQATYTGLWKCDPFTFEYTFPGDEFIQVLEGKLLIEFADGGSVTLVAGDIASFDKGLKTTWTIQESFKKVFVISNV